MLLSVCDFWSLSLGFCVDSGFDFGCGNSLGTKLLKLLECVVAAAISMLLGELYTCGGTPWNHSCQSVTPSDSLGRNGILNECEWQSVWPE